MLEGLLMRAPWIDTVGWALLHSLWQGLLIALAYAALHRAMRRSRPALRVLMGELALLSAVVLPIITVLAPGAAPAPALATPTTMAVLDAGAPIAEQAALHNDSLWLAVVALSWLTGVVLLALRAIWRWRGLRQIVARARPVDAGWQRRFAILCRQSGVSRAVAWLESSEIDGPLLIGWLKPVVLFPLGMSLRLPAEQVELLLEHELAHVRRGDFLFNLIQLVVETLLFFHPAIHHIADRVRHDRELACDDRVAARHRNPTSYARALLAVAELRQPATNLAMAASGGYLLDRVRRIVGEQDLLDREGGVLRPLAVAGLLLMLLAVGLQRVELPLATIKLPVAQILVNSLRQVGVEPVQLQAPSLPLQIPAPRLVETVELPDPLAAVPAVQRSVRRDELLAAELQVSTVIEAAAPAPTALALLEDESFNLSSAPLSLRAPVYPLRARRAGIEGWVDLSYSIAADGSIENIRIERSRPAGVFDQAAIEAMSEWRFAEGESIDGRRQRFDFNLSENGDTDPGNCELPTGTRICRRLPN